MGEITMMILRLMIYLAFYALVYILFEKQLRKTVREEVDKALSEEKICDNCRKKEKCGVLNSDKYKLTDGFNIVFCDEWERGESHENTRANKRK